MYLWKRQAGAAPRHRRIQREYGNGDPLGVFGGEGRKMAAMQSPPVGDDGVYWGRWAHARGEFNLTDIEGDDESKIWFDHRGPSAEELQTRPLLSLVMILKNEAQSIKFTIDSVKPYVDRYTIIDTGSTDGTPEIIKGAFGDTPGDIYYEPFEDFSTTRNRALQLEGTKSVFSLMLSGDESLRNGHILRQFCDERRALRILKDEKHEAYNVRVLYGKEIYDSARLVRTDAQWFYVGVTHEYMTNGHNGVARRRAELNNPKGAVEIFHDVSHNDKQAKQKRYALDLELLLGEFEKNPNRTRTSFYIGQSLECLHRYEEASNWYWRRFQMGGWHEEAYEARYRMGRMCEHMDKPWAECQAHYLEAHSFLPARAEPLYEIASHWYSVEKDMQLAYLFLLRAAKLKLPTHLRLFIMKDVYDVLIPDLLGTVAWFVKDYDLGWESVLKAVRAEPNNASLRENIPLYLEIGKVLPADIPPLAPPVGLSSKKKHH
jgi:glycosyltransferase involved in cell wall biosynthesis